MIEKTCRYCCFYKENSNGKYCCPDIEEIVFGDTSACDCFEGNKEYDYAVAWDYALHENDDWKEKYEREMCGI